MRPSDERGNTEVNRPNVWHTAKLLFLFCLLFSPRLLRAQDRVVAEDNRAIFDAAMDHSYNKEFGEANKFFEKYIALEPNDPAGYWRSAYNWYFNNLLPLQKTKFPKIDEKKEFPDADGKFFDKNAYQRFRSLIDVGIGKAEEKIASGDNGSCRPHYLKNDDAQPCASFYRYVKAGLISIRGGLEFKNEGILTAHSSL